MLFGLLSALLHWLKEVCFAPSDAALFDHVVPEFSRVVVSSAVSLAALTTFLALLGEGLCFSFLFVVSFYLISLFFFGLGRKLGSFFDVHILHISFYFY